MTQPPPPNQPPPNQPPQDQPPQQGAPQPGTPQEGAPQPGAFGPPEPQDTPPRDAVPQDDAARTGAVDGPQDTPPQPAPAAPEAPAAAGGFGPPETPQAPQTPPPAAPPFAPPGGPQLGKTPEGGGPMPHQSAAPPVPPAQTPPTPPQPAYGYPGQVPPGAPPTPPAPAYGYPQAGGPQPPQPPTAPGYGYPGQAPAPYAQSPQPPAPYGQQSYGQQGYGYPGQQPPAAPGYGYPGGPTLPMPAQPVPGAGGGKKINAQVAIIVSAVVAIALIVGSGIWYANSGDGGGKKDTASTGGTKGGKGDDKGGSGGTSGGGEKAPDDPAATMLFKVPMPPVKKDDNISVRGSWLTDKAYVKTGASEVSGYDLDKGTKLWSVPLPGPVCEASRFATEDHRTAIVFQASKEDTARCDQVAAIDLSAGKQLWKKSVTAGDYQIDFDNVTVSANTVAVGGTDGGAAFDIASGKQLWAPKTSDTCYDAGYGGGPKLVALRKCGGYDDPQLHVQTIDPASGKVISEYKMTQGIEYASIVSTEPLVVAADVGDSAGDGSGISDFFSIDNKTGELRTRISAPGDDFAADCEGITRIEQCSGLAVGNDRIYIPTEEHDGTAEYSRTNEIVAFDLATGKQTGQRADAGDGYTIYPLRMDGNSLIAYKRPPYDKGGQVVSIDGGSFKETVLLQNSDAKESVDAETGMLPEYSEFIYADGRLFMSDVYADVSTPSDPEYLALAFGRTN
ncbi:PQQ-binding-like beta-propeller repeat protein [Streptomyces antibioticus]|uniref:outer membrane protein assembly factor BamB family protein n=1 Tax=Streptomyces antibioticus TaxID=1890 RepID=UPI00371EB6F9